MLASGKRSSLVSVTKKKKFCNFDPKSTKIDRDQLVPLGHKPLIF